jgi:hypothetical protein
MDEPTLINAPDWLAAFTPRRLLDCRSRPYFWMLEYWGDHSATIAFQADGRFVCMLTVIWNARGTVELLEINDPGPYRLVTAGRALAAPDAALELLARYFGPELVVKEADHAGKQT